MVTQKKGMAFTTDRERIYFLVRFTTVYLTTEECRHLLFLYLFLLTECHFTLVIFVIREIYRMYSKPYVLEQVPIEA